MFLTLTDARPEWIPVKNFLKTRVLLYLKHEYDRSLEKNHSSIWKWCSIPSIALGSGVSANSLYVVLNRWANASWGYVTSQYFPAQVMVDGKAHTFYSINNRGLRYLESLPRWYGYIEAAQAIIKERDKYMPQLEGPQIKAISWPVVPEQWIGYVLIQWPFEDYSDSMPCGGNRRLQIIARDLNAAVRGAQRFFGITPSNDCILMARELEKFVVEKCREV